MIKLYPILQQYIRKNDYNLEPDNRDEKVIVLQLSYMDGIFSKQSIYLEDYSVEKNLTGYFFKRVTANAVSEFPSLFITTNEELESKYYPKLLRIIEKNVSIDRELSTLLDFLKENADEIIQQIKENTEAATSSLYIFTLMINGKYVGTSEIYRNVRSRVRSELFKDYYTIDKKEIRKKEKVCSVCFRTKPEVWGYVSTFNFYTAKTEFAPIAGGLKKEEAWKNYPVCQDCAEKLYDMKDVVENILSYHFCGFRYFLIPEFMISQGVSEEMIERIVGITEEEKNNRNENRDSVNQFTLQEKKKIANDYTTSRIFELLKEEKNIANYSMFFYETSNAKFDIISTIEGIYPSQFKAIYDAKNHVDGIGYFTEWKNILGKDNDDLTFRFDLLRDFFSTSRIEGDFSKAFLEMLRMIFMQKPIQYNLLLHRIVKVIQQRFVNGGSFEYSVIKAWMVFCFLGKLGVLQHEEYIQRQEVSMDSKYEAFFESHKEFFTHQAQKAVFLEGVLCQKLLMIQRSTRNATPFHKKLNGMKLSAQIIKKLFYEIIEKLEQYDKNYYRNLENSIAELMLDADFKRITNDEISFYFMMGMTLSKKIDNVEEENDN